MWQKGSYKVTIAGDPEIARFIRRVYSPGGQRAFDFHFMGDRVYEQPIVIEQTSFEGAPEEKETTAALLGDHPRPANDDHLKTG